MRLHRENALIQGDANSRKLSIGVDMVFVHWTWESEKNSCK